MSLKRVLAGTLLATSLVPLSYSQNTTQIKSTETEKVISAVINNLIKKPNLEKIEQRKIHEGKIPPFVWCEGFPFIYPEIPIYQQSATREQYTFLRNERLFFFHLLKENKIHLSISTENSEALLSKKNNALSEYKITHPEEIRINATETKIYFLHPREVEIEKITQKAHYLSGKEDTLAPLEESLGKTFFMYGGEKLIVNSLKTMKVENAQDYLNDVRDKYLSREQKVMNEFAKEINPEYAATKIQLYPSRTFGEKEIARGFSLEIKNSSGKTNLPFAIYVKPAFGDYDTGFGKLEILLRRN